MDLSPPQAGSLLSADEEVTLALQIEAGVLAADALSRGELPYGATLEELQLAGGRR